MNLHVPPHMPSLPGPARGAFTLVELLVVVSIIALLLGLVVPAFNSVKGGRDVTGAAYSLMGQLETARNYAISNHTYTWVGFYEQAYSSAATPTPAPTPPYSGVGHVTIGIVYSRDGTRLVDDAKMTKETLPAAKLGQVGNIVHLYGVHLRALDKPGSSNSTDPVKASTLQGRPYQTDLADLDPAALKQTLIDSGSEEATTRPFVAQGYTFYKTIRFNPRGEAHVNSTLACTRIIEIGLQPTRGGVRDDTAARFLAVQQAGIGGGVNIYRP